MSAHIARASSNDEVRDCLAQHQAGRRTFPCRGLQLFLRKFMATEQLLGRQKPDCESLKNDLKDQDRQQSRRQQSLYEYQTSLSRPLVTVLLALPQQLFSENGEAVTGPLSWGTPCARVPLSHFQHDLSWSLPAISQG